MSEVQELESYVELFDIAKDKPLAKAPLAAISHLPRAGERIFLPLPKSHDWAAYKVLDVEYFLAGEPSATEEPLKSPGMVKVTLFVERAR